MKTSLKFLPILGLAAGLIVSPLLAQKPDRPERGAKGERPAMNQRGQPGQMPSPGERLQMMKRHLDLTPEQATQIREIMRREMAEMRALRTEATGEAQDRRAEVRQIRQKGQTEIRAVLTPEQQAKLDARRAAGPQRKAPPSE
jgi:Spy/CpxP family protein refolding chaperone